MKKAVIIAAVDLSRMSIASVYVQYFEANGITYDIIYVDKYKDVSPFHARNYYPYHVEGYENAPFLRKLSHYWNMRGHVQEILRENQYDFAVVWGEFTSFLFADVIAKEMPHRYCLNIRDYFYNHVPPVWHRLKLAISNASFFTVSSEAYFDHLPKGNGIMMHSINPAVMRELRPVNTLRSPELPIRILYIGLISRLPYVFRMIDELGNDSRFEMIFAGIGSEDIDAYIQGKNINNIRTYGRFPMKDTVKYLKEADILYNLYGYNNMHFDTALSIKLYYAIQMRIPIMVFDGTHTAAVAAKCGIGFVMHGEEYESLGDRLYAWYHSLLLTDIDKKCSTYFDEAAQSERKLKSNLDKLLKEDEIINAKTADDSL